VARTPHEHPDEDEDDWNDEDDYDPEEPETYPSGLYDDDGPATVPCPYCGAEIIEDAEQCLRCGRYISKEDSPPIGNSGAWWVLVLLALAAVVMWVVGRG
jgi:hypothetical protein